MQFKRLVIIAAMLLWSVSFCVAPARAHACCKGMAHHHQPAPTMWCCVGQPLTVPANGFSGHNPEANSPSFPIRFNSIYLADLLVPANQSLQDHAFIPDQSGRHLEFSILLN